MSEEICEKCDTKEGIHYGPMGNNLFDFCPECGKIRPVEDIRYSCSIVEDIKSIIGFVK